MGEKQHLKVQTSHLTLVAILLQVCPGPGVSLCSQELTASIDPTGCRGDSLGLETQKHRLTTLTAVQLCAYHYTAHTSAAACEVASGCPTPRLPVNKCFHTELTTE